MVKRIKVESANQIDIIPTCELKIITHIMSALSLANTRQSPREQNKL